MSDEKQNSKNGLEHSIMKDGKDEYKTETEQLYDDMTKPAEAEQAEETEEQAEQAQEDEILSEEELEIQRKIEGYQSKIDELDERLNEFKSDHIEKMKRKQMEASFYSEEQIEKYIDHIEGETLEEIDRSILELVEKVPPKGDNFVDPSLFNGRAAKPKTVDFEDIGRQAFQRIKDKIF